jgi:hypothetical protein
MQRWWVWTHKVGHDDILLGPLKAIFSYSLLPSVARLYYGQPGMNGPVVFDFSSVKTGPGRFFGCIPIEQLGPNINVQVVCEVLADGYLYYFQFHQSTTEPGFLTTVRAQIPPVVPL